MSVPDVKLTVRDGALGAVPATAAQTALKIGTCQSGEVGTVYSLTDPQDAVTKLGQGPLTEAVCRSLAVAGGPVLAIRATGSVAGAAGAVTNDGTGTSVLSVAGAPFDAYDVKVKVVEGEASLAAGTATIQYSLDGGKNWSPIIAVPVSGVYAIPNSGLTVTFAAGTLVAGDVYSFACTAPGYSLTDLNAALTAALATPLTYGFIHVVGPAADAAGAAAMLAAVDTMLVAAGEAFRYTFGAIEAPSDTDANLLAAFANSSSTRVMVCAGFATVTSPVSGRQLSRSAAWPVAERIARIRPGVDPGRVADGALPGVVAISRDERVTPALDDGRFTTLRTIIGRQGYYITTGRMMAPAGSDFSLVQNRRVMDVFSGSIRNGLLQFLNDSVVIDSATGRIEEKSAATIEQYTEEICRAALTRPGDASDLSVTVDRTANILSTGTLPVSGRVVPLGYNKAIGVDVGFTNPALSLAAA